MRLRRILVLFGAVGATALLSPAAYAGTTSSQVAASAGSVSSANPDVVIASANVDVKVGYYNGKYSGEFKGTLVYQAYYVGKNYEYFFDVQGTLYARNGADVRLHGNFTPYPQSPKSLIIGDTTGTKSINYEASNSYGITNMFVEVCIASGPVGGCADSVHLAD
ncbi:MAG: hypothetical protein ACRDOK_15325 [Streptosporangiaceae bacterium]